GAPCGRRRRRSHRALRRPRRADRADASGTEPRGSRAWRSARRPVGGHAASGRLRHPRRPRPLRYPVRRTSALLLLLLVGCVRHAPGLPPLRVGTTGDYPPFSTGAGETPAGFDVEVARRFAADTGRRVEFVPFRRSELVREMVSGRFDVAMSGVRMRPERALVGTFTRPVAESGAVVLIRPEYARSTARVDLLGLRLGVNAGGYLEQVARRLFPHAILVPSADNRSLPVLLGRGSIEALLTDDVEADTFEAALGTVRRIGPLTRDRKAYLAREPGLARELDEWLRARDADGSLAAMRVKMLGPARGGPQTVADSDLR